MGEKRQIIARTSVNEKQKSVLSDAKWQPGISALSWGGGRA
jgi:hypothetical protein